jgi:anti-sigma factor RsiW
MKTFEEKWTAWIDGELTGTELAEFEATLPDKAAAEAEKAQAKQLGSFLKEQLRHPAMSNADFFNHQLRKRIESEETTSAATRSVPDLRTSWWTIRRLIWTGATSLAVFVVCTFFVVRHDPAQDQSQYLSQILNARVDPAVSPNASISIFEAKEDKVTVLWVEGLQTLPSEFAAK